MLNEVKVHDGWTQQNYEDQITIYKDTFVDKQKLGLNHLD